MSEYLDRLKKRKKEREHILCSCRYCVSSERKFIEGYDDFYGVMAPYHAEVWECSRLKKRIDEEGTCDAFERGDRGINANDLLRIEGPDAIRRAFDAAWMRKKTK